MQAVNSLTSAIEPCSDQVQELMILMLIGTPEGISDHIGVLDETSCLGIDEEGHVHKVAQFTPAMTVGAKIQGQFLKAGLLGRLIHDDDPALRIAATVHSPKEVIKAAAELLEAILHDVFVLHCRLFHDDTEERPLSLETFSRLERFAQVGAANFSGTQSSPSIATRLHLIGVELQMTWLIRHDAHCQVIQKQIEVINLSFEHSYARQNEVLFALVRYRTRIIDV